MMQNNLFNARPLPGEGEQHSCAIAFAVAHPANPAASRFARRRKILPLLGGEGRGEGGLGLHLHFQIT